MSENKVLQFRKKENNDKKSKGKMNKFIILVLCVLIASMVGYIVKSQVKIHELQKEKQVQEEKNKELARTKEDLANEMENINSDEYLEEMARKDLKLVKSGELVYILPEDEGDEDASDATEGMDAATEQSSEGSSAEEENNDKN